MQLLFNRAAYSRESPSFSRPVSAFPNTLPSVVSTKLTVPSKLLEREYRPSPETDNEEMARGLEGMSYSGFDGSSGSNIRT